MAVSTSRITYQQSLAMPENKCEEIVDGEPRLMPPPSRGHAFLIERIAEILRKQLDPATFRILASPFGQGIKRQPYLSYRIPDLAVYLARDLEHEHDHYIWAVPELIIECLSPANRKGSVEKLIEDYASIGVPEVWLVYPEQRALKTLVLDADAYAPPRVFTSESVSPVRLPGASTSLPAIWQALPKDF